MIKKHKQSSVLESETNGKNGVSPKYLKTSRINLFTLFILSLTLSVGFSSCSSYDEQDSTIIAYLKVNDLLESKLAKTCHSEIEQFQQSYQATLGADLFGWDIAFDYETDAINAFNKKYTAADGRSIDLEELEADIAAELWNYLNMNYADAIPAKAQNTEEGRYYTVAELKAKYPDYKEVEIVDFSPMELVSSVMNEKLFDWSLISEGDVNLRTLYVYYLANKTVEKENTINNPSNTQTKENSKIDYIGIIRSFFDGEIPDEVNINEIITIFQKLSTESDSMLENNSEGFKIFVNDYLNDLFPC